MSDAAPNAGSTPSVNPEVKDQAQIHTAPKPAPRPRPKPHPLPLFNVILLDDDDHSYDYVIQMLRRLCGHSEEQGYRLAHEVDSSGRAVVYTTHLELAELKRDQILSFGADPRNARCRGSMSAVVEPVAGE
jgi:ATP-dependent Clp protease adaptor protein ClpS